MTSRTPYAWTHEAARHQLPDGTWTRWTERLTKTRPKDGPNVRKIEPLFKEVVNDFKDMSVEALAQPSATHRFEPRDLSYDAYAYDRRGRHVVSTHRVESIVCAKCGRYADHPTHLKPCRSPYCECDHGKCTHPGFYDARGETP